jgi:hypothetical protein
MTLGTSSAPILVASDSGLFLEQMSAPGPKRHFAAAQQSVAVG